MDTEEREGVATCDICGRSEPHKHEAWEYETFSPEGCKHRPRKDDIEAGYDHCMYCVETGECTYQTTPCPGGYCPDHGVVWEVDKDRAADARNSAF